MILDLDYFKEVNDSHGHLVGDQVLVGIADLIRENVRHGDIPCRYGGEEFVVLLQGDNLAEASRVAEHIFIVNKVPPFAKTVSVGLACFS